MKNFICYSATLDNFKVEILGNINFRSVSDTLKSLKKIECVHEAMIIQKCNCTEIYVLYENEQEKSVTEKVFKIWKDNSTNYQDEHANKFKIYRQNSAMRNLFQTAVGLKSVSLGDSQVYGQVKKAFLLSADAGCQGMFLGSLQKKIKALSKDIDEKTLFRRGNTSVSRVVADIISCEFAGKKILVAGLGKVGSLLVKILSKEKKVPVTITNRNQECSEHYCNNLSLDNIQFSRLIGSLDMFDVICFTTSVHYLVKKEDLSSIKKPLVLIDLGNPQNVEEPQNSVHRLINLDHIRSISRKNEMVRASEVINVEKLVDYHLENTQILLEKLKIDYGGCK